MLNYGIKDTKRALRRSHIARLKKYRKSYWSNWSLSEKMTGLLVHTAKLCNCWMCRNPRKVFKQKTLKEVSFDEINTISNE